MKISAIILTKNERKNIERAVNSVQFCDEVIIVDDFSQDDTIKKAKKLGAPVFQRELEGNFADQRNFAMEKTSSEWVLFIDADEEVTDELKKEILKQVQDDKSKSYAYRLKRRDFFWGKELRYGEIRRIRQIGLIRLMGKNSGKWFGKVHEEYKVKSPHFAEASRGKQKSKVKSLKNYLDHYPHQTVKDFLSAVNFYSTLRAKELQAQGNETNIFELIFYPLGKFLLTYFIKLGFLDGPAGFAYAFLMSFHSFLVKVKLYQYKRIDADSYAEKR